MGDNEHGRAFGTAVGEMLNGVFSAFFPASGTADLPPSGGLVAARILLSTLFLLSVWGVALRCLRNIRPGTVVMDGQGKIIMQDGAPTWAMRVMMYVHHIVAAGLATLLIFSDDVVPNILTFGGDAGKARAMYEALPESAYPAGVAVLVPWTVGYFIAELILIGYWPPSAENSLMIFHHLFSILFWAPGIVYDFGARYALYFISTEITSIFLNTKWFLDQTGNKKGPVPLANGALFTLSFLVLRVAPIPAVFRSVCLCPPWGLPVKFPESLALQLLQQVGGALVLVPLALNAWWGYKVVQGARNILKGPTKKTASITEPLCPVER